MRGATRNRNIEIGMSGQSGTDYRPSSFFCKELPERIDSEYDDFERESSYPALVDSRRMALRVGLMTREYPPNVYGGAGVHVEYLSRELAKRIDVEVHCWGDQFIDEVNLHVRGAQPWSQITQGTQEKYKTALETLSLNLAQMNPLATIDIVHTHTWYVAMAGFLAKKLFDIPFVLTTHSLEPLRGWKAEQLGSGYAMSS